MGFPAITWGRLIMNASEPVYMELVDFVARGSTAEEVAHFRPSAEARKRVAKLLEKQQVLGLAKAKAQLLLATRS